MFEGKSPSLPRRNHSNLPKNIPPRNDDSADRIAPRVGNQIVDSGDMLELVQEMCPQHQVHHLVLCMGTDRYAGPARKLSPGSAPLRKRICIQRKHENLVADDEWESWERLTFKGLRRKGVPARVSLMIFASAKHLVGQDEVSSESSRPVPSVSAAESARRSLGETSEDPAAKRVRTVPPVPTAEPESSVPMNPVDRQVIDLASQRHGPKFVA